MTSDPADLAFQLRRRAFIDHYVAAYLAAEASRETERAEQTGSSHSYGRTQPVEDAFFLAECAWSHLVELDQHRR